jgi:sulfur relay (sulfurtransferase) complex TusBCD TusD component (DsrE family)
MRYLFIETQDPFDRGEAAEVAPLAQEIADGTRDVAVYLVQNAVLGARRASSAGAALTGLSERATVLVDDFSLRERGIHVDELAPGVTVAGVDSLVELIVDEGRKTIWQ